MLYKTVRDARRKRTRLAKNVDTRDKRVSNLLENFMCLPLVSTCIVLVYDFLIAALLFWKFNEFPCIPLAPKPPLTPLFYPKAALYYMIHVLLSPNVSNVLILLLHCTLQAPCSLHERARVQWVKFSDRLAFISALCFSERYSRRDSTHSEREHKNDDWKGRQRGEMEHLRTLFVIFPSHKAL